MYLPKPRPIRYSNVLKATAFGKVCNEEMSLDANRAYSSYTISKLNGLSCAKSKCAMATRMYTSKRDMSDTRNTKTRAAAEVSSGAMTPAPQGMVQSHRSQGPTEGQQRCACELPRCSAAPRTCDFHARCSTTSARTPPHSGAQQERRQACGCSSTYGGVATM